MDEYETKSFITKHLPEFERYSRRLMGNEADAQDVLQSGLMRIWERMADARENPRSWAYSIILNVSRDFVRVQKRHERLSEHARQKGAAAVIWQEPKSLLTDEDRAYVRTNLEDALDRIKPFHREVFVAYVHGKGVSQRQVAEARGLSEPTVRGIIARTRERLQESLQHLIDYAPSYS